MLGFVNPGGVGEFSGVDAGADGTKGAVPFSGGVLSAPLTSWTAWQYPFCMNVFKCILKHWNSTARFSWHGHGA